MTIGFHLNSCHFPRRKSPESPLHISYCRFESNRFGESDNKDSGLIDRWFRIGSVIHDTLFYDNHIGRLTCMGNILYLQIVIFHNNFAPETGLVIKDDAFYVNPVRVAHPKSVEFTNCVFI